MKVYECRPNADHFLRTPFIVRRFVSPERFRRDLKAYFALCSLSGCRLSVGLWSCVLPHQGRLCVRRTYSNYEAGASQLQVRNCGTAFQLICDKLTLAFNDLTGYYRHFCSSAEIAADWLTVTAAPHKFSYLLTYLLCVFLRYKWPFTHSCSHFVYLTRL